MALWQPDIALNYGVSTNYSHNFTLFLQNYVYQGNELQLHVRQFDIAHFSTLKIFYNQSIGLGLLYRFKKIFDENGENELRVTQQYNLTLRQGNVRFGNRLRSEQRISPSLTTHRFRYRLALDLPLRGEELDIGEPYFVGSTESLLSVAKGQSPRYDQWFTARMGWWTTQTTKWETGIEYRAQGYTEKIQNILFFSTSLVFSL